MQDFYSHTDWINGSDLNKLYVDWNDQEWIKKSQAGTPHVAHNNTINVYDLATGAVPEVKQVFYFEGGLLGRLEKFSAHQRYGADEPGKGRDRHLEFWAGNKVIGIERAHERAKEMAQKQSVEFINWAEKHMQPCVHLTLYGWKRLRSRGVE